MNFNYHKYNFIEMPLFIVINLILSFFAQNDGAFKEIIINPFLMDICLGFAGISLIVSFVKKWQLNITYDVFASSVLVVWFSYWQPYFKDDAPMFFVYPVYFAMLTAVISLIVIGHQSYIDKVTLRAMLSLSSRTIIQPWIIMICLFISLELHQNFLFFPTMMTLLIIRFGLSGYLSKHNN